jgi:hypothetical protein
MSSVLLSRRTALRGAGVALALPMLDAMLTDGGLLVRNAGAQPRKPPTRLVIFFIPNGVPASPDSTYTDVKMPQWTPPTTGRDFVVNKAMLPLAPFRDDINVLTNIDLGIGGTGGGHERGTAGFATCMDQINAGASGPSMEQVAAKYLGDSTRFRSLVVGDNSIPANYNSIPLSYISYSGAGAPVPPIRNPRALFDHLFGGSVAGSGSAGPSSLVLRRRSVMDFVSGDLTRLQRVLGSSDRQRLDAHLTALRELERQLLSTSAPVATTCAAPAAPTDKGTTYSDASERLLLDLTALALKCDLTRYASFMVAYGGASNGPAPGEHALCHAHDVEKILPITQYQVGLFAYLLGRLKDDTAREGNGTVLDNSLLYLGAEMSDGGQHSNSNVPAVLAGKAGGTVKTGRHIVYKKGTLMRQTMLAMLQIGGVPVDTFAGTRDPLSGLTTE